MGGYRCRQLHGESHASNVRADRYINVTRSAGLEPAMTRSTGLGMIDGEDAVA
jgi:hypothetical protein